MPAIPPRADDGLHTKQIRASLPAWIAHSTLTDIQRLKPAVFPGHSPSGPLPHWLTSASGELQRALSASQASSRISRERLAKTLATLKGVSEFTEPLLVEALKKRLGQTLDVNKNALFYLRYRMATEQHTLLQAALLNFEGNEDFSQTSLGETSALAPIDALVTEYGAFDRAAGGWSATYRYTEKLSLSPQDFSQLCRTLDLGRQYQDHLKQVFEAPDRAATVRAQMIAAQKDLLAVRVHAARMKNEITQSFYRALLAVLSGTPYATLEGKPLAYSRLSIFGMPLGEIVLIGPGFKPQGRTVFDWVFPLPGVIDWLTPKVPVGRFVVWIPGAPLYPLKEYDSIAKFNQDLAINLRAPSYQKLFASLLPQNKAAEFLQRLNAKLYTHKWNNQGLREQVYDENIDLNLRDTPITGEPFGALYDLHVQRLKDNALAVAVPTAEADRQAAKERLDYWLSIGMNVLNVAAFVVPGVGELMMAVTAVQLGMEVYHGIESWQQGDMEGALGHLESVALNVAFMASLGVAGVMAGKAPVIQVSKWVDGMVPVKLPNGEARLWKPDLTPYRSEVVLPPSLRPNAQGQYETGGKIYVRLGEDLFEKGFDTRQGKWRLKHPSNPDAYQPILEHNNAGAWRHTHENPLLWNRTTLLRRLGHEAEGFSDETLNTIGDISAVPDDVLRKVHMDGRPVPSLLADTLRQFRADRGASEVIEQWRTGVGIDDRYEYALPLLVQMPNWPAGRVLELFQGPEPWGVSRRYGKPLSAADMRATIKITRGEMLAGKLPRQVLAELGEQGSSDLLGAHAQGDQEYVFRTRLVDFAQKRKPALVDSLYLSGEPKQVVSQVLEQRFASLPRGAVSEVLEQASVRQRAELVRTGRVPAGLDNLARIRAQQGRLSRAITGLHRLTIASADSERLALHSLEQLPGWPATLRLEVRGESVTGPLIDSIGPQNAVERKYLVKTGDIYQAFDERGQSLNSLTPDGRNFFESIMQALPDQARQSLGLPSVTQDAELQQALARYATTHRDAMAAILKQRVPRSRPALAPTTGPVGYALSGRGDGFAHETSLTTRLRVIYPNFSEEEAERFVLMRLASGETQQQILHLLTTRQRELDGLKAILDGWAQGNPGRRRVADVLIGGWRQGLVRGVDAHAYLDLMEISELPLLVADFSHVRGLKLPGSAVAGQTRAALFRQFPNVKRVDLYVEQAELNAIADGLGALPGVTELAIDGYQLSYTPEFIQGLNQRVQLERLSLAGDLPALDVSGLKNLRSLSVSGSLAEWPTGVLALEHLEALNLSGTRINTVTPQLFAGHERVWRGLTMKWSAFEPSAFMAVFEHVHGNAAHLMDEAQLVKSYCDGSLHSLKAWDSAFVFNAMAELSRQGLSAHEQVVRVNVLREEHRVLTAELESWQARELRVGGKLVDVFYRQRAARSILDCWRAGLEQRYGGGAAVAGPSSRVESAVSLDLSGGMLGDLPELPAQGFTHVSQLQLASARLSLPALESVLGKVPNLRRLGLSGNKLSTLPRAFSDLQALQFLDLSRNQLTVTPAIQHQLNAMTQLQQLTMSFNRLGVLDVRMLSKLQKLDLSHTALREWPTGVLELPQLGELKLNHSAITRIPPQALSGHDLLMLRTNLRGCPLTLQACADIEQFSRRLYRDDPLHLVSTQQAFAQAAYLDSPMGIPKAGLAEGSTGGEPEYFPLEVSEDPDMLIALALDPAGAESRLTAAQRLRRLAPQLSDSGAVSLIDGLRESGLGALDIEARLRQWTQQHKALVMMLNEWIDVRGYREDGGWISAIDRRRAADRILDSWRHNLRADPGKPAIDGRHRLDLSGLYLGELPAVPRQFNHVTELNLNAVRLTEQGSNGFLRAFAQARSLVLNHNGLSRLPEALDEFSALTRFEAAYNDLRDSTGLEQCLAHWPALEWLDLSENTLANLDIRALPNLRHLDVHANILEDWPAGVLHARNLSNLDLSNNQIETIPLGALDDEHEVLMRNTDLSDNLLLEQELEALREYQARTGNGLGFSQNDIDRLLEGYATTEESGSSEDEAHPELLTEAEQKAQWFAGIPDGSSRHRVWENLKANEQSRDFFYIVAQLRHAKDFVQDKAELSRRVWEVLEAADQYPQLQATLFVRAHASISRVTCGDGWILLFSDLEVRVYEFKALHSGTEGQEGPALLKLATGIIRLEEVEAVAEAAILRRPGIDPAEIRLAYRIGLAQRLALPRQPSTMIYRNLSRVSDADIDAAYASIIAKEAQPAFVEKLVGREYWVDYLKRRYPAEFSALTQQRQVRLDALETRHSEITPGYLEEISALDTQYKAEQAALAIRLCAIERAALNL